MALQNEQARSEYMEDPANPNRYAQYAIVTGGLHSVELSGLMKRDLRGIVAAATGRSVAIAKVTGRDPDPGNTMLLTFSLSGSVHIGEDSLQKLTEIIRRRLVLYTVAWTLHAIGYFFSLGFMASALALLTFYVQDYSVVLVAMAGGAGAVLVAVLVPWLLWRKSPRVEKRY